jgi:sugar phosphate isomerase/epimerase
VNLGIRAHDLGQLPLEQLAKTVEEKGFTSIQLALRTQYSNRRSRLLH